MIMQARVTEAWWGHRARVHVSRVETCSDALIVDFERRTSRKGVFGIEGYEGQIKRCQHGGAYSTPQSAGEW